MFDTTDQLAVNTIRTLSLDAIQKQIQDIPGLQWALHQWLMYFGANFLM